MLRNYKIRQMLELVIAEIKMLKPELAQLKGFKATVTPPQTLSNNAGPASQATGNANHNESATLVSSMDESADAIDDSTSVSPPLKRTAKDIGTSNLSTCSASGSDNKYVTEGVLHSFGEQITENLSATFNAMLTEFADSIGTQSPVSMRALLILKMVLLGSCMKGERAV